MKPRRMSLTEIHDVLSREDMKKIMAGSGSNCTDVCTKDSDCNGGTSNTCNHCSKGPILHGQCITSE